MAEKPFAKDPKRPGAFDFSRHSDGKLGIVASAHYLASRAGRAMFKAGGNAVDAAVAAAFALGVVEPAASGLGGQTMAVLHLADGRTLALDGSSRAPNRTALRRLKRGETLRGYTATTVPSTPATLDYLRRRYGRLRLRKVLAPAIRLAEDGFPVSELLHALTQREHKALSEGTARRFFLKGGKPYRVGATLKQPELAQTLRRLAEHGIKDFYRGAIADEIAADMEKHGGLLRADDLAQIPRPIERRPLIGTWGLSTVATMPPPGAGRTLIEMLQVWQRLPRRLRDLDSFEGAWTLARMIRRAGEDRRDRPFDPDYFPQVRRERMVSQVYAKKLANELRGETTHLSAMDAEGNAVALTQSIERAYGARVATPSLGFLYNNYMSAFERKDSAHPYYLRPNAAPWASVAPTVLIKGGRAQLAIGSPGSERISTAILQTLIRMRHVSPFEAVVAPRIHCSVDGTVSLEEDAVRRQWGKFFKKRGFEVDSRERFSFYLGCVQLVMKDGRRLVGVADPRRDGSAEGWG